MSEKIGGAKGTELDDDFHEMERVSKCICLSFSGSLSVLSIDAFVYVPTH